MQNAGTIVGQGGQHVQQGTDLNEHLIETPPSIGISLGLKVPL